MAVAAKNSSGWRPPGRHGSGEEGLAQMRPLQLETITKAAQCAELLESDIREAHKLACEDEAVLEILLRELLGEAAKLKNRLVELGSCLG